MLSPFHQHQQLGNQGNDIYKPGTKWCTSSFLTSEIAILHLTRTVKKRRLGQSLGHFRPTANQWLAVIEHVEMS